MENKINKQKNNRDLRPLFFFFIPQKAEKKLASMVSEFLVCFYMGEEKDAQRLTTENNTAWSTAEFPMRVLDIPSITNLYRKEYHADTATAIFQ